MPLANPTFPSSQALEAINSYLGEHPDERDKFVKQTRASFGIVLTNDGGDSASWTIDLKDKGEVREGVEKPTVTLKMDQQIFADLVAGKAKAQALFMAGKIKITGDLMKSTKLEPVLKKMQVNAKL
jgi:putative sterol carrier protein